MPIDMKVTHLLYSGLGGHGSVFFSLIKADTEKIFDTSVIFCGVEDVRQEYLENCKNLKIPFFAVKKKQGIDLDCYKQIYKAFKKSQPDVIFLHGPSFILPAMMYRWRRKSSARIILRDTQAVHLKSKMDWIWLRIAARYVTKIIFLTDEAKEAVSIKIGKRIIDRTAVIISNGLDLDRYSPADRPLGKKAYITIGMQSRLQRIKDHPTLLRAFALLKEKEKKHSFRLRIAGDGDTMPDLVNLAKQLKIDDDVEFCGMLNETALLDFMLSLDIYVHATMGETMSNSIMQAMACQLPVVASNVWGVNNMIEDGVDGLLYESGDALQLSSILLRLAINPEEASSLGIRARNTAASKYSNKTVFQKYKAALEA
ncbi:MAG: glycosyltransferase [Chitinophagaceae bacterium]|nr:glycosyltransferase [Chitinophagaceae bacterium]